MATAFFEVLIHINIVSVSVALLIEAVHVELPHEAVDFGMPEVSGQDEGFEPHHVAHHELVAVRPPEDDLGELLQLSRQSSTPRIW